MEEIIEEQENFENTENQNQGGKIDISDEVITYVVILTLVKFKGKEIDRRSREYKYYRKQVTIERPDENSVSISVKTKIKYGEKIPEVTKNIQKGISQEVENITGLKVIAVNIYVEDIISAKSQEEEGEGFEEETREKE